MEEAIRIPRSFQQLEQHGLELLASLRGIPVTELSQSSVAVQSPEAESSYIDQYFTSHRTEDSFQPPSHQKDVIFTRRPWTQVNPVLVGLHFRPKVINLAPSPLEGPFGDVIRTINHPRYVPESYSAVEELTSVVKQHCKDDGALSLWDLLHSITKRTERITDSLKGGQRCFENRFRIHIGMTAQRQGIRSGHFQDELQFYVQNRHLESKEPVWMSIYYALRAGNCAVAAMHAKKAHFPDGFGLDLPEYYFSTWAQRPAHSPWVRFSELFPACLEFVRRGARKKLDSEYRYMVMSTSFLCGQIRAADRLISETPHSWDSLDEYLWYSIGCVRTTAENSSSYAAFDLEKLQTRLTASEESYYTSNGEDPLRYALVLFSVLELRKGMRFLLTNGRCSPYIIHSVHMVIALQWQGLLSKIDGGDQEQLKEEDVVDLIIHYARYVANHNPALAWEYYHLSQELYTSAIEDRHLRLARCLVDLLNRPNAINLVQSEAAVLVGMETEVEQKLIMEEAAKQCKQQGKLDIALALYLKIDAISNVVLTMNAKIAKFILRWWTHLNRRGINVDKEKWSALGSEVHELILQCMDFHDFLEFANEDRGKLIKETRALEKVFGIVQDFFINDHESVIREFRALEFIEECNPELLMESYPSMVDLISEIMSIFCVSLVTIGSVIKENEKEIVHEIRKYARFVETLPPPFVQKWTAVKKLQEAEAKLLKSN
eukprot:g1737.t1